MSHVFSERSFRSLRLSAFEVFKKTSFRGPKRVNTVMVRIRYVPYDDLILDFSRRGKFLIDFHSVFETMCYICIFVYQIMG